MISKTLNLRRLIVFAAVLAMVLAGGLYLQRWWLLRKLPSPNLEGIDPEIVEAITAARREVEKNPRSSDAWGRLGMVLFAHGFDETMVCLNRAAQLDPAEMRWPYYQARRLKGRRPQEAIGRFKAVVRLCGDCPDTPRLELAELHLRLDQWPEAEAEFRACLKATSEHPRALLGLGRLAFRSGDLRACRDYLERFISHEQKLKDAYLPKLKDAYLLLAQVKHREGDLVGAEEERRRAAEISYEQPWPDPVFEEISKLRTGRDWPNVESGILLRQGRSKEALALLKPAVQRYPDFAWLWIRLGMAHYKLGELAAAGQAFQKAIDLEPSNYLAHSQLGLVLAAKRSYAAAEGPLRRALELKPEDAWARCTLAICQMQTERWPEARQSLQDALRRKPDNVRAHVELGQLYVIAGEPSKAWNHVKQALQLRPNDAPANRLLLRLLFRFRLSG
jgi:tetratricopeptide (TPR) repeat protein